MSGNFQAKNRYRCLPLSKNVDFKIGAITNSLNYIVVSPLRMRLSVDLFGKLSYFRISIKVYGNLI